MRLKNYKADLSKRLRNPEYAAEYLARLLAEKDSAAFLIALKDVAEADGGVGSLTGRWDSSGQAVTRFSPRTAIRPWKPCRKS